MDEDPKTSTIHIENKYPESKLQLNIEAIRSAAWHICQLLGVDRYDLSITFCDDTFIQQLNRQYRSKDKPTDVLSFPQEEWSSAISIEQPNTPLENSINAKSLGDLVISIDSALKNAKNISQPIQEEIYFLMIHGLLHLCGHDHLEKEEESVMIHQQKQILNRLNPVIKPSDFLSPGGNR